MNRERRHCAFLIRRTTFLGIWTEYIFLQQRKSGNTCVQSRSEKKYWPYWFRGISRTRFEKYCSVSTKKHVLHKKSFKENLKGRDSNSTFPHKAFSTFANYIPSGPKPQTFRHISAAFYRQKKLNNEPKNVMWETRTSYFCFSFLSRKHANYF